MIAPEEIRVILEKIISSEDTTLSEKLRAIELLQSMKRPQA